MITFTRCAYMAKQACATFSQVVQKITPPIANNFLKFFFVLFAMLTLNAATAWGAETWSHTFTSTESAGSKNWDNINWVLTINGGTTSSYDSDKGAHYGTNNNTCTSVSFTTSGIKGTISSIKIEASRGSSLVGKLSVSVGDQEYTLSNNATSHALTTTNTAYDFQGNNSGNIAISWEKTSGKGAFYIKSITVTYEEVASCDKKVTLTKGSETNGTFTLDKANGSYDNCDEDFVVKVSNVVPTSSSQYCSGVNVTGGNSTVTGPIDGVWTVTYAKENNITSTITPTFADKTSAAITLSEAGATSSVSGKYVGDSYTLPSTSSQACGDKTFVGWSTEIIENSATKPTAATYFEPGASVTLGATNKFYAVFAEGDGSEILTSITGGDWSTGADGDWSTYGTDIYSGNGVKFDDANDYVTSPDMSSKGYTRLLLKFKSGHNGGQGSVLTFCAYNKNATLLTEDDVTIAPKTVVPTDAYTAQNTIYQVNISANEVIGKIMIIMTSKTKNLGMKYCEIFGVSSSYQNYTTKCVQTYKVTFNANGHGTAPTAQNVEENKKATEPTAPSATGYTFGGWYTDQACSDDKKFDFNTPITKDITLYAKWTANTYKIIFNAGTGTCGTESATATYADGITLPTATPSDVCDEVGWTFAGWATSSVAETTSAPTLLKANDKYQPTSSITLYAVYSQTETNLGGGENSATLTFDNTSKRTEFTTEKQVWTENGITLTNIKGTQQGAADVGDYSNPARLYKGSTTLVETSNEILKIVFTCSSSAYANVLANTIGNTAESSESIVTVASVGANSYAIPALGDQVRLKSITVTYTASGTSTTTYNSNPNCTPPSEYTITWWANGEEYYTQTAVEGTAIDVPTNSPNAATYACDDKVFVGWVGAEIIGSIDTKPTLITEFGEIEGDKAFFAVFATEQSSSTTTSVYKLVTNISGGKEYIFATGNSAGSVNGLTCDANSNLTATSLAVKVSDGLTYIETPASNNVVWNITGSSSSYQAQNKGQSGKYLRCYGTAPNAVVDETARALYWDTSKGLYGKSNSGSTSYYLYYDASSSKWGAKSSPSGRVYAFEKSEITFDNTTYSGYVTTCEASTEALSGKFSTGKYEYAEFATGNLQYKPSTDSWRFAKQQYQVVGEDNINVGDPNYKGWIDMLGWSTNDADNNYGVNPNNVNDLYDGTFQDWGDLFSADENWSTLSADQWKYLLNERTNASSLKQIARVGSVVGIMLFPDNWNAPLTVTAQHDSYFDVDIHNYTLDQWAALENAGALFLPAAGRRTGGYGNMINKDQVVETNPANLNGGHYKHQDNTNIYCYYWTSTINESTKDVSYLHNIQALGGDKYTIGTGAIWGEKGRYGQSVRLAKVTDVTPETYTRTTGVNNWGTICLPKASSSFTGATFYEVSYLIPETGKGLWLDQLADGDQLEAGKPYIFYATASEITVTYTGEAVGTPIAGANGLTGTFTDIAAGGLTGNYIIAENQVWVAGTGAFLLANRAYINAEDVPTTPQAQLPGRRRVCMGENTTTGLDNITNGENTTIKVIENGQLIIIRNGEKFNAQGQKL